MLRKKKKTVQTLKLLNGDGQCAYECPLDEYKLPEDAVLNLSNEFYADPEPCEIHRGAIHMRVYAEILDLCPPGTVRKISELDEKTRSYFPPYADSVLIEEETK